MKTKIKRHSRSVISVLLAVCMLVSCMTVGLIATDAAKVSSEALGYSDGTVTSDGTARLYAKINPESCDWWLAGSGANNFAYFFNDTTSTNSWSTSATVYDAEDGIYYYTIPTGTWEAVIFTRNSVTSSPSWDNVYDKDDNKKVNKTNNITLKTDTNYIENYNRLADGTWGEPIVPAPSATSLTPESSNIYSGQSVTFSSSITSTASVKKTDSLAVSPNSGFSKSGMTVTFSTPGTYTVTDTITYNAKGYASITDTVNVTATVVVAPPKLPTPDISFNTDEVDDYDLVTDAATANVTLTDAHYASIKAQDSSFTYTLYKDDDPVTVGVNTYTDNGNGTFTIPAKAANDGSYTLKAVPSNPATHSESDTSSAATLTVHYPLYSLVGNVDDHYMVGSTITNPNDEDPQIDDATWWTTYHPTMAVNTATGTPGVYRIQFKTKTEEQLMANSHTTINIGVVSKPESGTTGTQYAFVIGDTYYNYIDAQKNGDYVVPEEGYTDDDFYLCGLATEAGKQGGGSLVLKPNTTYVFEIDQTNRKANNFPWGKLALYSNSYNVTTPAKAVTFDAQAGDWNDLADATISHGVATATPSRVDKNNTSLLTATPASGYNFVGWYTDAECTTAAPDLTNNNNGTWTTLGITEAKTYYAKFEQVQPDQVTIATSVTGTGSIELTTGAGSGVQVDGGVNKAYVGAVISVTANNDTAGNKLSHWIVNGKRVEMNGYSLTDIPVTGEMNIQAVFVSTTAEGTKQKVKVRVNDTDYGTAVAKVDETNVTSAAKGDAVKIVLTPDQDAALDSITATNSHGNNVLLTDGGDNTYTFTMGDDDVTVNVNYTDYVGEANYWFSSYVTAGRVTDQRFSEGKYQGHEYAYYHVTGTGEPGQQFIVKDAIDAVKPVNYYMYIKGYNDFKTGNLKIAYSTDNGATYTDYYLLGDLKDIENNNAKFGHSPDDHPYPSNVNKIKIWDGHSSSSATVEIPISNNTYCAFKVYKDSSDQQFKYTNIYAEIKDAYSNIYQHGVSTPSDPTKHFYIWSDGVYGDGTDGSQIFGSTLQMYQFSGGDNAHTTATNNTNFYVIVYYPRVNYGTINGEPADNSANAKPVIVASETLPGQKPPVKPVDVYAKDGYIRDGYQVQSEAATTTITKIVAPDGTKIFESAATDAATGTTAHGTAGTTVSAVNSLITTLGAGITYTPYKEGKGDPGTWYEKVTSIPKGSTVSVRTVLANNKDMFAKTSEAEDSFRATHYVKGYVCNGVTYALHNYSDTGVYTEDITIPTDTKINNFEITPVYYMNDASNCKTFVIQGFDESIQKLGWGNTLYAYPYYNGVDRMQCAFGGYPGTALLCYGGTYMIQIPVTNDGTADGAEIRGLTLSNGYWDLLHREVDSAELNDHRQTYDYDDFYKIYKEKSPDNIYVSFKYRNVKNNLVTGRGPHNGDANDTATANRSDFEANGNGIEDYLDALNRPIDIFGNVLSSTDLANAKENGADKRLLIVSDGYAQTYTGEYATDWTIFYTENGGDSYTRVTTVAPSVLYMNNLLSWNKPYTSASDTTTVGKLGWYKDRYTALQSYMHIPVEITYEEEIKNNFSDVANRLDARWLYSNNSDKINAKIKIEYLPLHASKYIEDTFVDPADPASITGSVTGTKAYFTNYTPKNINKKTQASDFVINPEGTFDFMAEEASGYEFVGWYVQYDGHDGENKVNKEGSLDGHSPIIANATYVARFKAVQSGSLNVSHTVKKDNDHKGDGTPYIYYTITNDKGTVVESSVTFKDSTAFNFKNSAYIKTKYENYTIDVYLDADPKAGSTFAGYISPSFGDNHNFDLTTTAVDNPVDTWTPHNLAHAHFTVANVLEDEDGAFSSIAYFSQFTLNETKTYKYEITYTFPSRFWGEQKYKVTGNLDEGEVEAFVTGSGADDGDTEGAKLNQTFLVQNTPYESDFHKVLSWKYDDADQSCADVGTSTDHVYMITAQVECEAVPDNKVNAEFVLPFGGTVSGPLTNPASGANTDKVVFDPDAKSVNYSTDFLCLFQTDNSSLFFDDTGETVKYVWDNEGHLVVDEVNGQTLEQLAAQTCDKDDCFDSKTGQYMCHPTITVNGKTESNPKWLSYYWSRHIRPTIDLLEAPDNIYKLKDSKNDFANYKYNKTSDVFKDKTQIIAYLKDKGVPSADAEAVKDTELKAIADVRKSVDENHEYYNTYVGTGTYGMGKYYSFEPLEDTTVPRTFSVTVNGKSYSIEESWIQKYQINGMANTCNASECFDILTFTRWRVESINKSSALSKVLTYCYDEEFNFAGFEDYVVTPEYYTESEMADHLNDKNQYTTSITFLENNRNQWNIKNEDNPAYYNATHEQNRKSMVKADKIIADFNLSFNENGESLKGSGDVGVLIQQLQPLDDIDTGKPLTDAKQYAAKIGDLTDEDEITDLKTFIAGPKRSDTVDGKLTVRGSVDSNLLSSKNRMEWSYNFNNKKVVYSDSLDTPHTDTTDRRFVYRAISYMKIGDEYYLSKTPAYFTLYDIAVK